MALRTRLAAASAFIGRWVDGVRTARDLRARAPKEREDIGLQLRDLARLA